MSLRVVSIVLGFFLAVGASGCRSQGSGGVSLIEADGLVITGSSNVVIGNSNQTFIVETKSERPNIFLDGSSTGLFIMGLPEGQTIEAAELIISKVKGQLVFKKKGSDQPLLYKYTQGKYLLSSEKEAQTNAASKALHTVVVAKNLQKEGLYSICAEAKDFSRCGTVNLNKYGVGTLSIVALDISEAKSIENAKVTLQVDGTTHEGAFEYDVEVDDGKVSGDFVTAFEIPTLKTVAEDFRKLDRALQAVAFTPHKTMQDVTVNKSKTVNNLPSFDYSSLKVIGTGAIPAQ